MMKAESLEGLHKTHPSAWQRWLPLLSLVGVPLYLYANLFTFHNVPLLVLADQTFFWEYAYRMLQGDRIYTDFFQFTPPGVDLTYFVLLKLLGPSLWVVNTGLILLGVAFFWTCFSVAHRILSRNQALFTAAFIVVLIFGDRLDGTHHWFSLTLSLCAVRVVMTRRTPPRILCAGALAGTAAFFTQTAGAAAVTALTLALCWECLAYRKSRRETLMQIMLLVTAFALEWIALNAHFIATLGWQRFFYLQVTYPQLYVMNAHEFLFPDIRNELHARAAPRLLRHFFVYFSLAIYPPTLWYCWRRRRAANSRTDMPIVVLAMLGLLLMLEVITRANWTRIYCVASPALILLSWAILRFTGTSFRRFATIAAGCAIIFLAAIQIHGRQLQENKVIQLPAGNAALDPMKWEEYTWVKGHTQPGDYIFQASWLDMYLPLALRNPVFAEDLLPNDRTRPEMVDQTVRQLEQKRVKYIVWSPQWSNSDHAEKPSYDHLVPLRNYLQSHYTRVHVFSNQDEIWQRQ